MQAALFQQYLTSSCITLHAPSLDMILMVLEIRLSRRVMNKQGQGKAK
jgi:hypothetical protein